MKKKSAFAALFIIAALVLGLSVILMPGCSSSSDTNNENVIQGTITDAESGAKLEGVTVTAGGKSATSDSSGFYKLEGFVGGRYIVKASKDGYGNYSAEVIVSSWQPTTHDFSMTGNSNETKVIGTVTDGTWNPLGIEGVTVTVGGKSATTDSDGKYEITGVEVKNMTLTATKTGYNDYSADVDVADNTTTTHNFIMTLPADAELPFTSLATNFTTLFPTPSPSNVPQVYVRHKYEGTTEPISLASPGTLLPGYAYDGSISANGRYIVFNYGPFAVDSASVGSRAFNNYRGIYVYDKNDGSIENVSLGTSGEEMDSYFHAQPRRSISADGRYVVYISPATNLVENDTNGANDVFVYDRENKTTTRISIGYSGDELTSGATNASISADGRYIVYQSNGTNIVEGYTSAINRIYYYDMQTATTSVASLSSEGADASTNSYNPAVSADGRYVVFQSWATNLVSDTLNANQNVYIKDMTTGAIELASKNSSGTSSDGSCYEPSVSADGNYITFRAAASNLTESTAANSGPGTSAAYHIYLRNRSAGTTTLVTKNPDGTPGNADAHYGFVSGDGSVVYVDSDASNLVDNDTNGATDCFIYYVKTGAVERFSVTSNDEEGNQDSFQLTSF